MDDGRYIAALLGAIACYWRFTRLLNRAYTVATNEHDTQLAKHLQVEGVVGSILVWAAIFMSMAGL